MGLRALSISSGAAGKYYRGLRLRYDFYWMAFISVSGEPGCRHEELARLSSQKMNCLLVTESGLTDMVALEFGTPDGLSDSLPDSLPDKAWPHLATAILAK